MSVWVVHLDPAWIAVIGTAVGTVGLKIVEHFLGRGSLRLESRRDLNKEIKELTERVDKLEAEITFWRNRFYEEQEHAAVLRIMMIQNGIQPPLPILRDNPNLKAPDDPSGLE